MVIPRAARTACCGYSLPWTRRRGSYAGFGRGWRDRQRGGCGAARLRVAEKRMRELGRDGGVAWLAERLRRGDVERWRIEHIATASFAS